MRPLVIVARHQETNTVGSLAVSLGAYLHLVPEVLDEPGDGEGGVVRVSAVHTLRPHPARDGPGVRSQTSDGDTDVIIQGEDLLLVRRQITGGSFQGHQHGVRVGLQPHGGGALLHGLHGVLHLQDKQPHHRSISLARVQISPDEVDPEGSK